ncbi:hypothetical protein BDB00DRAFT_154961 [Zychaea mexicana]|uniref:uncharacterized protein n=1 Tax=Zychaea mexicana TaxID=64656 RepID=UPI0022FDCABA|nr:uncharacterized protein BDB00DRAFT_154961 [Zychaea mexicana]KAI9484313.1 hypothetical protein BDB00DRAFT_154961 [Zychaea mexicana]
MNKTTHSNFCSLTNNIFSIIHLLPLPNHFLSFYLFFLLNSPFKISISYITAHRQQPYLLYNILSIFLPITSFYKVDSVTPSNTNTATNALY